MSVTAAAGFRAAGVSCGIKQAGRPDLAVVVNDGPSRCAAGVFTSNRFAAAPVLVSREHLASSTARAVVLNSGGANACTGARGLADARAMAALLGSELGVEANQALVCSTGLIGSYLPMDAVQRGISAACRALGPNGADAAEAILTTDTHAKQAQVSAGGYAIGGMAKGAGMLAPGLATMLVVITTDALVEDDCARTTLASVCEGTFNRVDSDGCMSTNDTVLLLASGASGVSPDEGEFRRALGDVCADLAAQLIGDAEGASHDIAVTVAGAATEDAAVAAARAVTRSNLFKAAVFGRDPNWGRILSALGTLDAALVPFDPGSVDVAINGVAVCRGGGAISATPPPVDMSARAVGVAINLNAGAESATVWTNDLTYDYVHENSAYSS